MWEIPRYKPQRVYPTLLPQLSLLRVRCNIVTMQWRCTCRSNECFSLFISSSRSASTDLHWKEERSTLNKLTIASSFFRSSSVTVWKCTRSSHFWTLFMQSRNDDLEIQPFTWAKPCSGLPTELSGPLIEHRTVEDWSLVIMNVKVTYMSCWSKHKVDVIMAVLERCLSDIGDLKNSDLNRSQ